MQHLKKFRIGPCELGLIALVITASLMRFMLIYLHWPTTNSDEGTMDLMALHIAYQGEHPIFFYGQDYMGPLEAYIGAPLFHLFGVSVFTLRLGLLPFFALFLVCMYFLTSLLYTKKFALLIVALLSLGSSTVILHQLRGIGGYPEIVLFAALIFLLATQLALSSHAFGEVASKQERLQRFIVYGFLGLVVGLALWSDMLILPYAAAAGLLLFLCCRRELRTWAGPSLLLGFIIGALPLIIYNVTAPLERSSLSVLLDLQRAGAAEIAAKHIPFVQNIVGTFLIGLPTATSAYPLCPLEIMPFFGPSTAQTLPCTLLQGGWSAGFLILWTLASALAVGATWRQWRYKSVQAWSFEERQAMVREFARFMLLTSAGLTLVLFARSPAAALVPSITSRYLICLLSTTPAVLWPLWNGISTPKACWIFRIGLLLLIATTLLAGTIRTFEDIPDAQTFYQRQDTLIADLLHIGATRIYSDYWTCDRLIFQSQERIICSNLDTHLQPAPDRYTPYHDLLKATPHPAYVFRVDSAQAMAIEREVRAPGIHYQRYVFEGYVVLRVHSCSSGPIRLHRPRRVSSIRASKPNSSGSMLRP